MENQNIEKPSDHQQKTDELMQQSDDLRARTKETNEKLADLQKRVKELLHPDKKDKNDKATL